MIKGSEVKYNLGIIDSLSIIGILDKKLSRKMNRTTKKICRSICSQNEAKKLQKIVLLACNKVLRP